VSAAQSAGEALLVVVSPVALAVDGESVRVARDVLGAAFAMKAVVPEDLGAGAFAEGPQATGCDR